MAQLDFPNLPYWIDNEVSITESRAILAHIARKHRPAMLGATDKEKAHVDMLVNTIADFGKSITALAYNKDYATLVAAYAADAQARWLKLFAKYLGDKPFLTGAEPCIADFMFWELLDESERMVPTALAELPTLTAYHKRFAELPAIAKYIAQDPAAKYQYNNKSATFK